MITQTTTSTMLTNQPKTLMNKHYSISE